MRGGENIRVKEGLHLLASDNMYNQLSVACLARAISSAGKSAPLTRVRSLVRVQYRPFQICIHKTDSLRKNCKWLQ